MPIKTVQKIGTAAAKRIRKEVAGAKQKIKGFKKVRSDEKASNANKLRKRRAKMQRILGIH